MNKFLLAMCLIIITNILVVGQSSGDYNKNEFFIGFNRQGIDDSGNLNGFEASYTRNVSRYFGVKGDVSATFRREARMFSSPITDPNPGNVSIRNRESIANFLVGVQAKDNASKRRFKPFAHALVGVGRLRRELVANCTGNCRVEDGLDKDTKDVAFSTALGGGLDIKLNKKIDLRAIQVDYNPIFTIGRRTDTVRFSIGIVFK